MNKTEALTIVADIAEQGIVADIVNFEDGEKGVHIRTKAGPSVGIVKTEQLEAALKMVEGINKRDIR